MLLTLDVKHITETQKLGHLSHLEIIHWAGGCLLVTGEKTYSFFLVQVWRLSLNLLSKGIHIN